MKSILIVIIFFFSSPIFSQSSNEDDPCREKLAELSDKEMFGDHNGYELMKGIEKLLKKCPNSALIHWAYAENLQEKGAFFNVPEWQKTSFLHYSKAFELDTTDVEYRWSYASVLEYIGQYNKASAQFRWFINNDTLYKKDAKAHMIACNFLYKNRGDKSDTLNTGNTKMQLSEAELSTISIKKRRNFEYLNKMTAATSIAGNITGSEGDGKQIQVALGFLSDWEKEPTKFTIAEQNDLLVAILVTLSSMIVEKGLNMKVGDFDFSQIKNELSGYADKSIPKEYGDNFKKLKPQEGRTFEIGNDLKITEKWSFSNLSGDYEIVKNSGILQINKLGWSRKETVMPGIPGIMGKCVFVNDHYYSPFTITQSNGKFTMVRETKIKYVSGKGDCGANAPGSTESIMTFTGYIKDNKIVIESIFDKFTSRLLNTGESKNTTTSIPTGNSIIEILPDGTLKYINNAGWSIYKKIK